MKKFYVIFLFYYFISGISFSQQYWISQSSPTHKDLSKCFFINNNTGWIAGDSGFIIKTFNSGENWVFESTGINQKIQSLFFLNERLGYALAWELSKDSTTFDGTIILKTVNGGNTWTKTMYPDTNAFMGAIYFLDSLNGFMGGVPKFMLRTTDGGNSWINVVSDSVTLNSFPVSTILFYNNQIGFSSGGTRDFGGVVWSTSNGGLNWKPRVIANDPVLDLYIVNPDSVFALSGDYKFGAVYFFTSDQGHNWGSFPLNYFGPASTISFRTKKEGWISLGYAQKFFYTINGGTNWSITDPPDSTAIFEFTFSDSLHGWGVGANGAIIKYNPMTVQINTNSINSPEDFFLYQNYPNPFNPKTIINYQLSMPGFVSLKVFDALGKEVTTLVNDKQNAGTYTVEFDSGNLSSGIYFYELTVGDINMVKKMVLLK